MERRSLVAIASSKIIPEFEQVFGANLRRLEEHIYECKKAWKQGQDRYLLVFLTFSYLLASNSTIMSQL